MKRRRSPQQKKALSYARDCRPAYGESHQAARHEVPRRKQLANKANRHRVQQTLSEAVGVVDEVAEETTGERLTLRRPVRWRKSPDMRLGEWIAYQSARQASLRENPRKNDRARARRQARRSGL